MGADRNVDLCSQLGQLLNHPPISIELLPGDSGDWLTAAPAAHAPFLFIDGNLGVPHKVAYKLYLESVQRFQLVRPSLRHAASLSANAAAEVLTSSAVLLLVNPAHQTALNTRKQLVHRGHLDPARELRFAAALLTLRDGAKQSILWHHRRWLLRRIYGAARARFPAPSADGGTDRLDALALDADTFRTEFSVVDGACEVYPRNYHAWAHRSLCADALVSIIGHRGGAGAAPGLADVLGEESTSARVWIERHVSDYSAMQYHCRLRRLVAHRELGGDWGVCGHATELLRAYPAHESLWLYLRDVHAEKRSARDELKELATGFLSGDANIEPQVRRHAGRALAWTLWQVCIRPSSTRRY
ncbi:hypothetical protein C8Q80DRAFT_1096733 [Daedaleopsis nitida]|nr:hypothetical protein C8Q80DRAFT_1096733 [Daedaleopsis nitida]